MGIPEKSDQEKEKEKGKKSTQKKTGGTSTNTQKDNTFEKCKTELEDIKNDNYVRVKKEYYDTLSTSKYDKKTYKCEANNTTSYHVKKKTASRGDEVVVGGGDTEATFYSECGDGPFQKGCKDVGSSKGKPNVNGMIYKLQGCLQVKQDSLFGPDTERALKGKFNNKVSVTKEEIESICSGTPVKGEVSTSFGVEEQKEYWQKLKDNGQIYTKGLIYLLKNGATYVYIIKRKKDGTKVPILNSSEVSTKTLEDKTNLINSFDEFDYEILYPINPASKATLGEVGVLTAGLTQDDESYVKILKDDQGSWKPAQSDESFEISEGKSLTEQTIKTLLKLRLFEQNVKRNIGSSSDPNKVYTSKGTDAGKSQQKKTEDSKNQELSQEQKTAEIKSVMAPKQTELLKAIDDLIVYTEKAKFIIKKEDKIKKYAESRQKVGQMDSSQVCSPDKQKELNDTIKEFDISLKKYDLALNDNEETYLKNIKSILVDVINQCKTIETKYAKTSETDVVKKSDEPLVKQDEKIMAKKDEGKPVTNEVKAFIESNGYTYEKPKIDEKERLASRTTVGQQLRNLDADGIYVDYYNDTTPIWKASEESFEELDATIKQIKSDIPRELKRGYCKRAINMLYRSAFPSTRVIQLRKRSVIDDDKKLFELKSAVIQCDEEKNFAQGIEGIGDELNSLYRCRTNKKGKSYYGVDRYCLKDFKKLKQDNPTMQMESIVRKHISEAIKSKKLVSLQESKVQSILKEIKRLKG